MLLSISELYWEVLALRVNPACGIMGHLEFPGFDTLSWSKCRKAQNERDAVEDVEEEGRG